MSAVPLHEYLTHVHAAAEGIAQLLRECPGDFAGSDSEGITIQFSSGELFCWYPGPMEVGAVFSRSFHLFDDPNVKIGVNFRILRPATKKEIQQRWSHTAFKPSHGPTSQRGYWYLVHGD